MNNPSNFVTADLIASRLQLSTDLDGVIDTLNSASASAQLFLEELLDSKVPMQAWDVLYYLDSQYFAGIRPQGLMRISLPSGFVRNDPVNYPITVGFKAKINVYESPVDPTHMMVDYDRGIIFIDPTYADNYIHVTCTTGYKLGTDAQQADDGTVTPATGNEAIPDWLQEAILAYVPRVLKGSRGGDAGNANDVNVSDNRALDLVANHVRTIGFCFHPIV